MENGGDQAYMSRGCGAHPGAMAGLRFGPLSLLSCGRLHAGGARPPTGPSGTEELGQGRAETSRRRRQGGHRSSVESTIGELEFRGRNGTTVVAQTTHHTVGEGGRGADTAQPHHFFVQSSSDTMAQPPIRNMMLGAVRDIQRVDVGTLPQQVRWKPVSVTDVIRSDDVYTKADGELVALVDGAGTKWMDSSVYADVTLTSGAPATKVLAAFLMQDKLLWVSRMMRYLSEVQTAAIRAVPGMGRAHIQSAKDTTGELQAYVTADPHRWQEVQGHMVNALHPQTDLFLKKPQASMWEDTKPLVAGMALSTHQWHDRGRTEDHDHGGHSRRDTSPPRQGPGVRWGANNCVEHGELR